MSTMTRNTRSGQPTMTVPLLVKLWTQQVPPPFPRKGRSWWKRSQFFRSSIHTWAGGGEQTGMRAKALAGALQTHIRLIVLDLGNADEPQAIFETLNAHGTPLLPADLIKNWLLWETSRQHLKKMGWLYQTYWRDFDRDAEFWRTNVGTGHAARARVDTFLQNWLTRRTQGEIAAKHLYQQFLGQFAPHRIDGTAPAQRDQKSALGAQALRTRLFAFSYTARRPCRVRVQASQRYLARTPENREYFPQFGSHLGQFRMRSARKARQ